jgi:hypothetical protein
MKNVPPTSKTLLLVSTLLVAVFYSCSKVRMEQNTSDAKVCENTVYVQTKIYTYKYGIISNTLEYSDIDEVKKHKADSALSAQYEKAYPVFVRVQNCY